YSIFKTRIFFISIFIVAFAYTIFLKTELYESKTALIVRDLSAPAPSANLGLSMLGMGSNSQLQDSMVVQEYLLSLDTFLLLDKEFGLIKHYKSENLDCIERLALDATMEESLEFYRQRILINYDEISGILHISYMHTTPQTAQNILNFMIKHVEYALNEFNRKKAKKQLSFMESEHDKKLKKVNESSALLEVYQNENLLLDPTLNASSSSTIIASLESTLTQKRIEYKTKSNYLNRENYELLALEAEIKEIVSSLAHSKKSLTGDTKDSLNKILFEYEKLKMQLEFDTDIYKNVLIQLETVKLDALKEAKTLSIVSKPNLPDGYISNKPKTFITLLIVISLFYGIFSMLLAIIKDHKE
ncbi:MAG: hypothetical protein U9P38_07585, partial [Campylobacterota bacterium]|nr:hypothetical protein [Campylobacterota bacterium]